MKVKSDKINVIRAKLDQIDNISSIRYKSKTDVKNEMQLSSETLESVMKVGNVHQTP